MKYIEKLKKSYTTSPSLVYFLLENKAITIGIVGVLAFLIRFLLALQNNDLLESLGNGLEFASIISASFIAVLLYFKDAINLQIIKRISEKKHTTVFGLGEFSTALLENEMKNPHAYIIFEKNISNDKIEHFRKVGMGVVEGNAFDDDHLSRLNFETMDYAVITLGNDRLNIELASKIIEYYNGKKITSPIKLVIHIINKDLNALFHQNFITQSSEKNAQIDIQTFSFYEEAAESFFEHNFIDGESNDILESDEEYHIVLAGNGELASNVIYQAAKLAHLPNENKLTIHIVDKEAKKFKNRVIKRYTGITEVLEIEAVELDYESLEYFKRKDVWFKNNLTHVIVCYDDEEKNIEITTDLFNKTYLSGTIEKTLTTRINFAIFNAYHMSKNIDADQESFKQFFSFADVKSICTRENLLDEEHELIAKLVHNQYAENYDPSGLYDLNDEKIQKEINEKWYNSSKLSDKLSSKAQAKHIDIKLKALGLRRFKSAKKSQELLKLNRELFDGMLKADREGLGLSDQFFKEYSQELPKLWEENPKPIDIRYFPKEYTTMFEKIVRAEHNRWNAYHYLNGWTYKETKSKPKKEHDCLLPLNEFVKPELQLTVIYDMYAILYIPNYLANAGFEIMVGNV